MNPFKKVIIFIMLATLTMSLNPLSSYNEDLAYYQADYKNGNYFTILRSGTESDTTEVWGVDKDDINKLPKLDLAQVNYNNLVQNAKVHLEKRFQLTNLAMVEIKLARITELEIENNRNWFVVISFQYTEEAYMQLVPMLIDGRIILSKNE